MAGLLQTGTLVDGQWMTTNVDINTVLERNKERKDEESQSEVEEAPVFGILTQTVIHSPVIHWIFPARIRSAEHPDVAFIGNYYLQIRRFSNDGQLRDVAWKADFDSRIRNAGVVDLDAVHRKTAGAHILNPKTSEEGRDVTMHDTHISISKIIPPQFLVLALESGDLVFLFAKNVGTAVEFITYYHRTARSTILGQPGKHLALDPSSRYLAVAGSQEGHIAVYSLHSKEELANQQLQGKSLRLVSSERYLHVNGVIVQMQFLFPSASDPDHVILILLVVRNASTAIFVFEWVAGQSLTEIRSNNSRGHIIAARYRIPLLLIPLTIRSAFLLVSAGLITECTHLLEGSPKFLDVPLLSNIISPLHIGLSQPLWTSWTRPSRTRSYSKHHDDIYIAREDGFVAFLEICDTELEWCVQAQVEAGRFDCNIGTAFASLEVAFEDPGRGDGDFLAAGGDSSSGGVYIVAARKSPVLVEPIMNWSPTIDFVTSARARSQPQFSLNPLESSKRRRLANDEPDRIFACTGRGPQGAVSEIRFGCEARLQLDISGLDLPIKETWVLNSTSGSIGSEANSSLLFLLSVGNESVLLSLAADSGEIEDVNQSLTWLDLSSRTLAAAACNGLVAQITERAFIVSAVSPLSEQHASPPAVDRVEFSQNERIIKAALYENELAVFIVRDDDGSMYLRGYFLSSEMDVMKDKTLQGEHFSKSFRSDSPLADYPNTISIVRQSDRATYVVVCTAKASARHGMHFTSTSDVAPLSTVFRLAEIDDGQELVKVELPAEYWLVNEQSLSDTLPEVCVDIVNLRGLEDDAGQPQLLLAGYRSGLLVMRRYNPVPDGGSHETKTFRYPMGSTPVTFKFDPKVPNVAFICCDSKLWRLEYDCLSYAHPVVHRVWMTELGRVLHTQPNINHVSFMPQGLLLTSGKGLLVASIDPQPKPIPRTMLINGAPCRLLYSHHLGKLVVAMASDGQSTLEFLDPQTGSLLGQHFDSAGRQYDFPPGLGNFGEKILCLVEWEWKGLDTMVILLIVGTSSGGLLMYTVEQDNQAKLKPADNHLRCVSFFEEHYDDPICAISASANTFFFCVGQAVRWASLDGSQNKLLTHAEYKLPSRAISMSVEGHWLNVLTVKHSLITFLIVDRKMHPQLADHHGQLFPQFADEPPRDGFDQVQLPKSNIEQMTKDSTLVMVADKDCSVVGLWRSEKTRMLAADYGIVFEAELRSSILKFRLSRIRPPWDKVWEHGKITQPSYHEGELFGIGIDGSVTHFTFLTEGVWRLLRFLQEIACRLVDINPKTPSPSHFRQKPDYREKHIEGEILRQYLTHRRLEQLLMIDDSRVLGRSNNRAVEEFCSLVDGLHIQEPGQETDRTLEDCLKEAHQLVADLLRPIL